MKTFEEILGSVSADDFLSESWGCAPRIIKGADDKFDGVFDWQLLNSMLEADFLRPPRLRLVHDGKNVATSKYVREVNETQSLNAAGITQALGDGAALIIDQVDALFPPVRRIAEGVEDFFGVTCQVNLYCGWRASKGFDVHWDVHDVLVLQVEGSKFWQVWEPTRDHPLPGDKAPEPKGEPYWQGTLTQGDVIYLPRGWWHRAEALEETSVHLTMGTKPATGRDFVHSMKERVAEQPYMRANLPMQRDTIAPDVIAEVAHRGGAEAMQEFLHNDAAQVWTRPQFDLPASPLKKPIDIDGGTGLKLAWTRGLEIVSLSDTKLRVASLAISTECSAELAPYLRRLSGVQFTTLDEVRDGLEDRNLRRELAFLMTTMSMRGAILTA